MTVRRVLALAFALVCVAFSAYAPAYAQTPTAQTKLRVVSVGTDPERNVSLVLRLDTEAPTPVPTTAFTVSPRADDELEVSRRGAQGLDLMLVYGTNVTEPVLRAVHSASAELLLSLPAGSRIGVAGSTDTLSADTASSVLALERVRTDRSVQELLAAGLDQFAQSAREPGRSRSLVLFDVGPFPDEVRDLATRAKELDVAVYVVRLTGSRAPSEALDELASHTGGTVTVAGDPEALGGAAARALVDVQSRYDLRFRLPEPAPSEVKVTVKAGSVSTSTTVALPRIAVPATDEPPLPPTTITAVALAGAIGAVFLFAVFARIWLGMHHPHD